MITRTMLLSLLLLGGVFAWLPAQSEDLRISPASVSKEVVVNQLEPNFEDISTLRLTNVSNKAMQLRWNKETESQPGGWRSLVYNKKPGYGPYTAGQYAEADEDPTFTLAAGQTIEFYLILRPGSGVGKGRIILSFESITRPGITLASSTFDFNVHNRMAAAAPSTSRRRGTTRVYPNPAVDNFFVELPSGIGAGKIEIYNTLGRRIRTFATPDPEKGYLIKDLPEGIYLINVYDDKGEKLKTLRLLHRRFGA